MPGATVNNQFPYPLGPDPIDTAGDIERLAKAIDLEIGPNILAPPRRQVRAKNTGQAYPGTNGAVMWNNLTFDTTAGIVGVGGGNIIFHVGGVFHVEYSLMWGTAVLGSHAAWVWHSGGNQAGMAPRWANTQIDNSTTEARIAASSCILFMNPGDYIQLQVLNITSNPAPAIANAEITITQLGHGGWSI